MTCFWDGILKGLHKDDLNLYGISNKNKEAFISFLKSKNSVKEFKNVRWNGFLLKKQEIDEHMEMIKNYDIKGIYNGHLTSTCDSFLLLICSLFKLNINHRYLSCNIRYKCLSDIRGTLNFSSNRGHFTFMLRN